MSATPQPPQWVNKLLGSVCKEHLVEEIEGDLLEFYADWQAEHSSRKANLLYLYHAIKFLRPYSLKSIFKSTFFKTMMIKTHLKIAYRQLVKHKAFSFLNIGGLALGMLVVTMISLWIWDELSYNDYHENVDRVARVMQNQTFEGGNLQTWRSQAIQLAPALRDNYGSNFEHIATASFQNESTLFYEEEALKKTGIFIEPSGPALLSLEMVKGSRSDLQGLDAVFISESTAIDLFGYDDPMNQVFQIEDRPKVKVTGVFKDLPSNSSYGDLDFIATFELYKRDLPEWLNWGNSWFQTLVQISPSKEMAEVSVAIKDVKLLNMSEESGSRFNPQLFLHPMSKWHLFSEFKNGENTGGRIQYVRMFGTIGIFVLLLACINFMNLSTARSENRAKEIGIRKAIGSERAQLIGQFFAETMLVAFAAFLIAMIATYLLFPFFNQLTGKELSMPWNNPIFWLLGLGFTLFTGLIAGSYPALYLSSFQPVSVLKGAFSQGRSTITARRVLVIIQFTVSITLIIGTAFVFEQIQHVKNRPLGYENSNLIIMPVKGEGLQMSFDAFRNELLQTGVAEEVSKSSSSITQVAVTNSGLSWQGKDPAMQDEFLTVRVNHEFGKSIGWELIAGRDFSREFQTDKQGFIINKAAAAYLGFENPVGEKVNWGDHGDYTILGVVKNMVTRSPYDPAKQTIFFLEYEGPSTANLAHIKLAANNSTQTALASIEQAFRKHDQTNPFEYHFVDQLHAQKFDSEERVGKLSGFFALLATLISCLGLYGMVAFVAQQRTKEIGIRKVLGASVISLWGLLTQEFVRLMLIASVAASALAYYFMDGWLQQFEYHINQSVWIFIVVAMVALIIGLITVSYHTFSAATINPVKSLKSE
ncbi:MAG: FtsX-like permease family protein [Cyclobacteriaceae bacterium]